MTTNNITDNKNHQQLNEKNELDLPSLRKRIDELDSSLVKLLNDRANVSINIGRAKRKNQPVDDPNVHIHIPVRELAVYERVEQIIIKSLNPGPLTNEAIQAIFREIMSASISLQREVSIAYLGPPGTFSHQAAFLRFGDSVTYVQQPTIADVFQAVSSGSVTYAIVPFENSTHGSVSQTLDSFIQCPNIKIRAESYVPIRHCLLSKSPLDRIKRVYSHPEALGQCQKWLNQHLKHAELVNVSSTAHAAELAAKEHDTAAVCSLACKELYGLNILEEHVEDLSNNTTRFFILGNKSEAPTSQDRTLVSFTLDHRQPGALCDALSVIKEHKINLTKIDSRPSKHRSWHYIFFVEMEGHVQEKHVQTALDGLKPFCIDIRVLGSYRTERPAED